MSERSGRHGLVLVLLALLALAVTFDLTRRNSFLRSVGRRDEQPPVERMIRGLRDELPRSRPR